jgi:hypothetical protein
VPRLIRVGRRGVPGRPAIRTPSSAAMDAFARRRFPSVVGSGWLICRCHGWTFNHAPSLHGGDASPAAARRRPRTYLQMHPHSSQQVITTQVGQGHVRAPMRFSPRSSGRLAGTCRRPGEPARGSGCSAASRLGHHPAGYLDFRRTPGFAGWGCHPFCQPDSCRRACSSPSLGAPPQFVESPDLASQRASCR